MLSRLLTSGHSTPSNRSASSDPSGTGFAVPPLLVHAAVNLTRVKLHVKTAPPSQVKVPAVHLAIDASQCSWKTRNRVLSRVVSSQENLPVVRARRHK